MPRYTGDRRRRGIPARCPLSVAVITVSGAVKAMTGDVTAVTRGSDPALDVTGTAPCRQ